MGLEVPREEEVLNNGMWDNSIRFLYIESAETSTMLAKPP
jgi:hypothetical protein